jgi:hypothetical protein
MLFGAFIINVEISTNRLTPYLSKDRDSSYYHLGWWPISTEIGEPRAAHPWPLGGDGGGGFRQAGTGDVWGEKVLWQGGGVVDQFEGQGHQKLTERSSLW